MKPTIENVSNELQCELDDAAKTAILAYWDDLRTVYRDLADGQDHTQTVNEGIQSDDHYNALLSVYESPRKSTETGPLDDLTVAVKDNIATRDLRMTCGLDAMDYVPSFDAVVVERLLDAGVSLVGKANMDAFALGPAGQWSEFGTVKNPRAANRVPGGSSSGSGVAVAAGLVDVALGTDTGGSIRSPAACCGVVDVRPTQAAIPRYGLVELAPSADTIGPLTRDVNTARRALDAIAGTDCRDRTVTPVPDDWLDHRGTLTVGVISSTVDESVPDVQSRIGDAIDVLAATEAVTVTDVDVTFGAVSKAFSICLGAEFAWLLRQSFTVRGQGVQYNPELSAALSKVDFNTHVSSRVLPGALLDAETNGHAYALGRQEIIAFGMRLERLFTEVDILLTPTLRVLPPKYGEVRDSEDGLNYSFTKPFSLTGGPAVSVPVGSVDELPVSAQLVAPAFNDGAALRVARLLEANTPGYD